MITEQEAIERAKEHLTREDVSYKGRNVMVSLHRRMYIVDFLPPEGMRAGEFTVLVNANNGEIMGKFIWR
jgi:hypothetical protein